MHSLAMEKALSFLAFVNDQSRRHELHVWHDIERLREVSVGWLCCRSSTMSISLIKRDASLHRSPTLHISARFWSLQGQRIFLNVREPTVYLPLWSSVILVPQEMFPVGNEGCAVSAAGCPWCLGTVPLLSGSSRHCLHPYFLVVPS